MSHTLCETIHIQNLIKKIHSIFDLPNPMTDFSITLHKDNLSAIAIEESLKFIPCTKQIAIKYHHFCSQINTSFNKSGDIKIKYILTKNQIADVFTKQVDADSFFPLQRMLCVWQYRISTLCLHGSVRIQASRKQFRFSSLDFKLL